MVAREAEIVEEGKDIDSQFKEVLYRNCLALKLRIDHNGALLHVSNILEVYVAAFIGKEVDLVCLIDATAKGFVVIEGLLAVMSTETLSADVVSAFGIG